LQIHRRHHGGQHGGQRGWWIPKVAKLAETQTEWDKHTSCFDFQERTAATTATSN